MIRVTNRFVATEPFPVQHITGTAKGGLAFMDQKIQLTRLEVVVASSCQVGDETVPLPSDNFSENPAFVYVRADQFAQSWAKQVYELNGKPFILVPCESVVLAETARPKPIQPPSQLRTSSAGESA